MTSLGKTLKTKAADVRLCGKTARGVHIVNIDARTSWSGMDRIVNEDNGDLDMDKLDAVPPAIDTEATEEAMPEVPVAEDLDQSD